MGVSQRPIGASWKALSVKYPGGHPEGSIALYRKNPEPRNMSEDDDAVSFVTAREAVDHGNTADEDLEGLSVSQQLSGSQTSAPLLSPPLRFQDNTKPWFSFGSGTVEKSVGPSWVPDSAVSSCTTCSRAFDWFNRKHHCRYCGKIFCNSVRSRLLACLFGLTHRSYQCSSRYKLLPVEFGVREPQRTCGGCAAELEPFQEELQRTMSNQTRQLDFDPNAPSKYLSPPVSFSMTVEISKAAHSLENIFGYVPNAMIQIDRQIPEMLLRNAIGIAFLTVLKGGFLVTAKIGTGLVVAKLERGWSAPSAIGTVGVGWGPQIGGELSDLVIVLTRKDALDAFSGTSQVAIGAELGVAVGPFGRTGDASLNIGDLAMAPCYAYSQSSGLFAGVSLEGAIISCRSDVNQRFYGCDFSPTEILSTVPPPRAAQPLYDAMEKVFPSLLTDGAINGAVGASGTAV